MPLPAGKQFRSFSLYLDYGNVALLPDEHDLVLNVQTGQFALINWNVRYVVADGRFDPAGELPLAFILLDAWPSYVENIKLLQVVTGYAKGEVADLIELGGDQALDPLRCLVDACRKLLRPIGIEIQNINGLGFKLSHFDIEHEDQRGTA
jgi:hypothetical protein